MNVDGSNPINITNNPEAHDTEPKWSPDGRKLAFTSHGNVIIININGEIIGQHAPEKRIADHPSWSPDSGYVALHSTIDGNFEIYTMKDTGTELTRLTVNPTYADGCPEWSPDGEFIAFGSGERGDFDLYLMRPDGSDVTDSLGTWAGGTCPLIDWSPDGKFLATISRNLGVFNRDERNQHRIIAECAVGYPDWSPDGQKIVFAGDECTNNLAKSEIYVINSNGTNLVQLTNNTSADYRPAWSPDGERIAFVSLRDGNREIYGMNTDGSQQTNLTLDSADDDLPAWQP